MAILFLAAEFFTTSKTDKNWCFRLIESKLLMGCKYEGSWRAMDTLRDRYVLEEKEKYAEMPWHVRQDVPLGVVS